MSDKLSFIVNNIKYDDSWESVSILTTMQDMVGTITLSTVDFWKDKAKLFKISMGDEYKILINDELIGNGWIEIMTPSYTDQGNILVIEGRDKACDLIDCHFVADAKSWSEETLMIDVIKKLCAPFNIRVIGEQSVFDQTSKPLKNRFVADEGKTIFELIMKLTLPLGILAISKGDGNLYLTRATETDIIPSVLDSSNVLSAEIEQNDTERFSEYIVKSTASESEILRSVQAIKGTTEPEGRSLRDNKIRRNRPYVLLLENANGQECQNKAIFEKNMRIGQSRSIEYEVSGWTQIINFPGANLRRRVLIDEPWRVNTLMKIKDKFLGVDQLMLLSEVEFIANAEDGLTSKLRLVPPETFSLIDVSKFKTASEGGLLQQLKIEKSKVKS